MGLAVLVAQGAVHFQDMTKEQFEAEIQGMTSGQDETFTTPTNIEPKDLN